MLPGRSAELPRKKKHSPDWWVPCKLQFARTACHPRWGGEVLCCSCLWVISAWVGSPSPVFLSVTPIKRISLPNWTLWCPYVGSLYGMSRHSVTQHRYQLGLPCLHVSDSVAEFLFMSQVCGSTSLGGWRRRRKSDPEGRGGAGRLSGPLWNLETNSRQHSHSSLGLSQVLL